MSNLPSLENEVRNRLAALGVNATAHQRELMERLAEASPADQPAQVSIKDTLWVDYVEDRDKQEAIEFFKQLGSAGCGTYTVGRHRKASRIIWKFDIQQIARVFLGRDRQGNSVSDALSTSQTLPAGCEEATDPDSNHSTALRDLRVAEPATSEHSYLQLSRLPSRSENAPSDSASTDASSIELYDHAFLLRPGLKITVSLPLNITKDEANRLAEFIRSVPF